MPAEKNFGFSISWISRMLRTRFDARARALGLTRAQWSMMFTIKVWEGATQSELASRLEINSVTAGRIIDRLEASGWTERRPDQVDRRVNRLFLTPEAWPMLERLSQVAAEEERISLMGLTAAEKVTLAELLGRIITNLKDQPAPSAAIGAIKEPSGTALLGDVV